MRSPSSVRLAASAFLDAGEPVTKPSQKRPSTRRKA